MTPEQQTAMRLDAAGQCIVCQETPKKDRRRGLCTRCYERFKTALGLAADADAFEETLILRGLVLPSRQGQKLVENAFIDALQEFQDTTIPPLNPPRTTKKRTNSPPPKNVKGSLSKRLAKRKAALPRTGNASDEG